MATIDDVESALVSALGRLLFPGTAYQPGAVGTASAPLLGSPRAPTESVPVRLYVGAPGLAEAGDDTRNGISQVCVFREKGMSRSTTRFKPYWRTIPGRAPTLTIARAPQGFAIGGTAGDGNVLAVRAGNTIYAAAPGPTDPPGQVAYAFASQIPGATVSGTLVQAQGVVDVRIGRTRSVVEVTGQEEQVVNIALLAARTPTLAGPNVREALTRLIDGIKALRDEYGKLTRFLPAPDGTHICVKLHDQIDDDTTRRENLWRRWWGMRCEYSISRIEEVPPMLAPLLIGHMAETIVWLGPGAPVQSVLTNGYGLALSSGAGSALGSF